LITFRPFQFHPISETGETALKLSEIDEIGLQPELILYFNNGYFMDILKKLSKEVSIRSIQKN
jgi:hypothetical protein